LKPESHVKVMEGKYDDRASSGSMSREEELRFIFGDAYKAEDWK
jgi:hypothetical protein